MTNTERSSRRVEVVSWLQLVALVVGLSTVIFTFGRREERLEELGRQMVMISEAVLSLQREQIRHTEQIEAARRDLQRIDLTR